MKIKTLGALVLLVAGFEAVSAQDSLDNYYAFPFSFGADYAPLTPVLGVTRRATVNDLSAQFRMPIGSLPVLQPFVTGGVRTFDSDDSDVPTVIGGSLDAGAAMPDYDERETWDHSTFFGAVGLGWSRRLSRVFEFGVDASVGFGQSVFSNRFVSPAGEWVSVGSPGLTAGIAARIGLDPSYNFSISVAPALRYDYAFGAMQDFDGLYFGVGIGASYRFGQDPDAPLPDIRAIRVTGLELPPVFAAMQSVYVNEPIASFEIENTSDEVIEDVLIAFNQPGFMDSPTQSAEISSLAPGETASVPLHASFNQEVFRTNGVTPLNGELVFQYTYRDRPIEQRQSVTYDLHDRNALTWTDDRKVAAFITSSDSAIRNYSSFIRSAARDDGTEYFPDSLEFAMQAYHALSALGILYQPDPSSPFTQVQENTVLVDSINLPRETLRSVTGDCDDLTVLYNTMLESVGIKTGFVTIPGHIYTAINTEVAPDEYSQVHSEREMMVEHEGTMWILVEITLVGQTSFVEAWRTGMRQWRAYENNESLRTFHTTAASQQLFRAVGLTESDLGLQYGDPNVFLSAYRTDLERLSLEVIGPVLDRAESRGNARTWNSVGVAAGRLGLYDIASNAFGEAASLDGSYVSPLVNQGSLAYLQGELSTAIAAYRRAENLLTLYPDSVSDTVAATIYVNLSRALYDANDFDEARRVAALAEELNEALAASGRLAETDTEGGRASQSDAGSILFLDDEVE